MVVKITKTDQSGKTWYTMHKQNDHSTTTKTIVKSVDVQREEGEKDVKSEDKSLSNVDEEEYLSNV